MKFNKVNTLDANKRIAKRRAAIFFPNEIVRIKTTMMNAMDGTNNNIKRFGEDKGWKLSEISENASGNHAIPTKIAELGRTLSADVKI